MNVKCIQKLSASVVLLITLISFSGFSSANVNIQVTQTELFTSRHSVDYSKIKTYRVFNNNSKNISYNQYTVFNFKSLLNTFNIDFSVYFKTQKETTLQFIDLNNSLKQNLIAQALSKNTSHISIK